MECQSCWRCCCAQNKEFLAEERTQAAQRGGCGTTGVELQPGPVAPVNDDDKLSDGVTETVDCGGGFASKTSGNRPAEGKVCDVEPLVEFLCMLHLTANGHERTTLRERGG